MKPPVLSHRLVWTAALSAPMLAHAHTGVDHAAGIAPGFVHPLGGLDHLLAMIAVGLWAAQMGGRARWVVPMAFVSLMAAGGALGMGGVHPPFVEPGIVGSVLVLGVLIASAARLPLAASAAIVGLFAIFHGSAHGAEMPASAPGLTYAAGFLAATALLHATGIGFGVLFQRLADGRAVRIAGAAIAACALYLALI